MPRLSIWQALGPTAIAILVFGSIAASVRYFVPGAFASFTTTIQSLSPPIQAVIVFISITSVGGLIKTVHEYRQTRYRLTEIDSYYRDRDNR